jgi:quinol monooxygenase YgiN
MRSGRWIFSGVVALLIGGIGVGRCDAADRAKKQVVRIAELEIDPAQVEAYTAALKREIEASIRVEPGVLRLYAVSLKGHPEQVRVFEVYASHEAYQSHLQTPHFKDYKASTQGMVKTLRLVETEPVMLGSK